MTTMYFSDFKSLLRVLQTSHNNNSKKKNSDWNLYTRCPSVSGTHL